ncbi:hypothetical protein Q3G72_005153 [Acer saccharum]|nr:hypothetical protein Q3G72_005153 [Acer saccharum]
MFGVVFPNRSFPIDISTFSQIDTFHWILDMNTFVGEAYDQVREVCIFLLNNFTLPPDKALAVYIQSPGSQFMFVGAVTLARPSAVLSLPWPEPGGQLQLMAPESAPPTAKIGVSVVDLATLSSLDVVAEKRIERLAMKVGENLFNFMQSFCGIDGNKLVVPMDILDRFQLSKVDDGWCSSVVHTKNMILERSSFLLIIDIEIVVDMALGDVNIPISSDAIVDMALGNVKIPISW